MCTKYVITGGYECAKVGTHPAVTLYMNMKTTANTFRVSTVATSVGFETMTFGGGDEVASVRTSTEADAVAAHEAAHAVALARGPVCQATLCCADAVEGSKSCAEHANWPLAS